MASRSKEKDKGPRLADLKKDYEKALAKKKWVTRKPKAKKKEVATEPKPKVVKPRQPAVKGGGQKRKKKEEDEDDDDDEDGIPIVNEEAEENEQKEAEAVNKKLLNAGKMSAAFDDETLLDSLYMLLNEDTDGKALSPEDVRQRYEKHEAMKIEAEKRNVVNTILAGYINTLCPALGVDYWL